MTTSSPCATSKTYAVRDYPTVLIIGRDGQIAWSNEQIRPKDRMHNMKARRAPSRAVYSHKITIATVAFQKLVESGTSRLRIVVWA